MGVMEDGWQKGSELLSESIPLLLLIKLQIGQENRNINTY